MASKTGVLSVDGDATYEAVTALVACSRVYVRPLLSVTTGGYKIRSPLSTDSDFVREDGEQHCFYSGEGQFFQPGQVVGYLRTVNAGPFDFGVWCE